MKSTKSALILIAIIVIVSRVFFLDAGYGSEEDAWGVALTAKHIAQSGEYEASRLPGHPLQELFYASIVSKTNAFGMNAATAIFSLIATIFFFLILKKLNFNQPFLATIAFVFTPIIYMHSTDSMDYLWALAFMMMSYYWLLNDKIIFAGMLLHKHYILQNNCAIIHGMDKGILNECISEQTMYIMQFCVCKHV